LSSKFSILGINIDLGRDELRKNINAKIKGVTRVILKIDTK